MSRGLKGVKAFFERLPCIRDIDRSDLSQLMKVRNPSFYDFSNSDSLVYGTTHAFKRDSVMTLFLRKPKKGSY